MDNIKLSEELVKCILKQDNVAASLKLEEILQKKCAEKIDAVLNK